MQFLKRLFQFYIFSNIHVALGVFFFIKITFQPYHIIENKTALFVFFSTIVAYNFIRFFREKEIIDWFLNWINNEKKALYLLLIFSAVNLFFLMKYIQFKAFLWLLPFVLVTFFYGFPLPFKKMPLRTVAGLKLFLIAISFAGITVLFPLAQHNIEFTANVWITFFQRFVFTVLITIPFDIRDLFIDSKLLKTLPQIVGVKKAKIIGFFIGFIFVLLELFKQPINKKQVLVHLIISIVAVLFLMFSKEKQSKFYSAFWVEAIPIFWFLVAISILNM